MPSVSPFPKLSALLFVSVAFVSSFQTFFVQQFPVDFRTPLLIFYLRGELTDGDVFGFVSVAPVTRMMILERRKKKKRKMRQLSRTRERSFHGREKERRMREENGGEKKKYALVALSISSFPFQRGALLRSGDATAHDERTNERRFFCSSSSSSSSSRFFFRGGVGGDVLRDEFVCVAKSFFLFFFWRFVRTRTR